MSQRARDLVVPVAATAVALAMSFTQPFLLPAEVTVHLRDVPGADGVIAYVPAVSVPGWVDAVAWPMTVGAVAVAVARIAARVRSRRAATEVLGMWFSGLVALLLLRGTLWWVNLQPGLSDGVRLPGVSYFSLPVVLALGFGLAWALCARPRPVAPPPLPARLPAGVQPDRVVWSGSARLSARVWAQWPAFVLVVLPQAHLLASWWSLPTVAVVAAILLTGLPHLWGEVTVGPQGIRIRTRPGGVRWRVPWTDVAGVDVVDMDVVDTVPVRRITSRRVQLRSGPTLRIRCTDRPGVLVTVDDADVGAAVAQHHLEAARGRAPTAPAPTAEQP